MAARKTLGFTPVGLFAPAPADAGVAVSASAATPVHVADKHPPPEPLRKRGAAVPPPDATAKDFPNWANPEGRLAEYVERKYCPPPPRHPIHGAIDVAKLIVELRGAVDTLAPAWLCGRIMKDAAYALETTIQHCYLCDMNHTGTPCDPGDDSCTDDQRERAYKDCEHYATRCRDGVPK